MKKASATIAAIVVGFGIVVILFYLIYKVWDIFGFWTLVWTGSVELLSSLILWNMIGSRKEKDGIIIYNPKEWPKFIHILVCIFVGVYLYSIISLLDSSSYDYIFGLSYLILIAGVPIIISLYRLVRDKNDFVKIYQNRLSFKDNKNEGSLDLLQVKNVNLTKDIILEFHDQTKQEIKLSNMNFNLADRASLLKDINARVPKVETGDIKQMDN